MGEKSGLRLVYDAVERRVALPLEALIRTREFVHATAVATRAPRRVSTRVNAISARLWHLANLPAGTDVQRLRVQVGQLDREVRRLRLELAAQNHTPAEGVSDRAAEPDERA
jgi:hypothetical protein